MPLELFKEKLIINNIEKFIEPAAWNEFKASKKDNGIYKIHNDDLPIMRDLKAFLNILTSIQTMHEKITTKYALFGATVGYRLSIIEDLNIFYQNFKIYRSTNSIVSGYLKYLKQFTIDNVIPEIIDKMKKLSVLFTIENLDKVAEFITEQVILLEQYQDNFKESKQKKQQPSIEKKNELSENNFTKLIKYCNEYVKKIYGKEDYEKIFLPDTKTEKLSSTIEYYPEKKSDSDTIKNVKLLLNGVIGIKKLYDDYEAKQQSNTIIDKVTYISSFILNLRKAFSSLSEFDYQAILAEKSTPFTDEIKSQLKKINEMLEKISCHADQLELELRLKEGTLLNQIQPLIDKHNQIMCELRIPTNFVRQKNIYYKKRLKTRVEKINDMDDQINFLKNLMNFKFYALRTIPPFVKEAIKEYIEKYYDQICMNRSNLDTYKKYLEESKEIRYGFKNFIQNQVEYVGNSYGFTKHSELMFSLSNRLLYLIKQKHYVLNKNEKLQKHYKEKPFDYIKLSEAQELGQQATILKLLKSHEEELQKETDKLTSSVVYKKEAKVPLPTAAPVTTLEPVIDKDKNKARLLNLVNVSKKELKFFSNVIQDYEIESKIIPITILEKEEGLSSKTVLLLHELSEFSKLPEPSFQK